MGNQHRLSDLNTSIVCLYCALTRTNLTLLSSPG